MPDDRLRALERRWRSSGTPQDEAAYLLACARMGELPTERLSLAAFLGYEPARLALGDATPPAPVPGEACCCGPHGVTLERGILLGRTWCGRKPTLAEKQAQYPGHPTCTMCLQSGAWLAMVLKANVDDWARRVTQDWGVEAGRRMAAVAANMVQTWARNRLARGEGRALRNWERESLERHLADSTRDLDEIIQRLLDGADGAEEPDEADYIVRIVRGAYNALTFGGRNAAFRDRVREEMVPWVLNRPHKGLLAQTLG